MTPKVLLASIVQPLPTPLAQLQLAPSSGVAWRHELLWKNLPECGCCQTASGERFRLAPDSMPPQCVAASVELDPNHRLFQHSRYHPHR